jgi:hypothetical protein
MATKKKTAWYNEVTPLSKGLAMFMFIVLPFVGFFLGVEYGKSLGALEVYEKIVRIKAFYEMKE